MYAITEEQKTEMQSFIDKIPDSIVKSQIINLWNEILPTNRMTPEQLEKLMSFQNALPKELQTYPQTIAQWFKNDESTTKAEAKLDTPKEAKADLATMVADSHAHVNVPKLEGDEGEQKQEILHTLNVEDETLAGTKAEPKLAEDKPTYTEQLQSDAAQSKKSMKGNKTEAQKKEEDAIIARNQDVDTSAKAANAKSKTVVVQKAPAKKSAPKAAKPATKSTSKKKK